MKAATFLLFWLYLEKYFKKSKKELYKYMVKVHNKSVVRTQPAITCSKLTLETLEQGVEYVQS